MNGTIHSRFQENTPIEPSRFRLSNGVEVLVGVIGAVALPGRPTLDFQLGADSPFSRYIGRPLMNYLTKGAYATEEQFQEHLDKMRRKIANSGRPVGARIATWPWSPDYDSYRV